MAKKGEDDVSVLIAYAKELGLTGVELVRENFVHPRPDFVISFYESVFEWINANLSKLDCDKYDHEDIKVNQPGAEFGPEIQLCAKVYSLLKKSGIDYFSINDVLSSKIPLMRTKVFFRTLLTFLTYMNSELTEGECCDTFQEYISKERQVDSLEMQKEELLKEIRMKRENHDLQEMKLNKLKEEMEVINEKHEGMLKWKKEREEINVKGQAELNKHLEVLTHKAEYFKMLNVQEQHLLEKIVSADEHQALRDIEESLKQEVAELEKEDLTCGKHEEVQNICKYYTEVTESIEALNFKQLNVLDAVHVIKKHIKELQKECDNLNSEIKMQESTTVKCMDDARTIEIEKQTRLIQHKAMKEGVIKDIEAHKLLSGEHQKQLEHGRMQLGKAERDIIKSEEEYLMLQSNEFTFHEQIKDNYRKLLNAESRVVVMFDNSVAKNSLAVSKK